MFQTVRRMPEYYGGSVRTVVSLCLGSLGLHKKGYDFGLVVVKGLRLAPLRLCPEEVPLNILSEYGPCTTLRVFKLGPQNPRVQP